MLGWFRKHAGSRPAVPVISELSLKCSISFILCEFIIKISFFLAPSEGQDQSYLLIIPTWARTCSTTYIRLR